MSVELVDVVDKHDNISRVGADWLTRWPEDFTLINPDAPEGEPDSSWKVADLTAYAAAHSIDLNGATKKADIVAAIAAPPKPSEPTPGTELTMTVVDPTSPAGDNIKEN